MNPTPSETTATTNTTRTPVPSTSNTTVRPKMKTADESIATQQLQDRVFTALMNHQLLLRYAIANDLSVPQVRVYFEKLAAGFEPDPIISNWNVFDD